MGYVLIYVPYTLYHDETEVSNADYELIVNWVENHPDELTSIIKRIMADGKITNKEYCEFEWRSQTRTRINAKDKLNKLFEE